MPSMKSSLVPFSILALAVSAATPASAGVLSLSPAGTLDISALNITTVGDLAIVDQRIWIADGTTGGIVHAVSITTGAFNTNVDPSIVPGFTRGADALGSVGVSSLFVFSSFGESAAGRINTSGALQSTFPSAYEATGADFGAGGLWIASGTTAGAGSTLLRLDTSTGAILETVPVLGLTARIVDLAVDPHTGGMYALCDDDQLRQIDVTSGVILAMQDLAPFLIGHDAVAGGMDFDSLGERLYIANGPGAGSDSIVVLERSFADDVCGADPVATNCPCANAGAIGHGCVNSVAGNNGAVLVTTGVARRFADSLVLHAAGMPPGTSTLFFQGTSKPSAPIVFGDGTLCVNGTVIRLGIKAAANGTASYPSAGDDPIHVKGVIPFAITKRHYQTWYRNGAAFCTQSTFNLTNAVVVEWRP